MKNSVLEGGWVQQERLNEEDQKESDDGKYHLLEPLVISSESDVGLGRMDVVWGQAG